MEKKKKEKTIIKISKDSINKKQNKQIMWAIILMVSIILIVVLVPIIKQNFFDKFVYLKLDFQKTKIGDLIFYSANIPVTDFAGKNIVGTYSINFRSDPRKIESIPVNIIGGNVINFTKNRPVYITLNPQMEKCDDNIISMATLAGFLKGFGGLNIKSAVTDEDYAKQNNLSYITCKDSLTNTVIYIDSGDETKIEEVEKNCYKLTYSNCEMVPVAERFIFKILENYMDYFVRGN